MDFDNRKVYGDTSITDGLVINDTTATRGIDSYADSAPHIADTPIISTHTARLCLYDNANCSAVNTVNRKKGPKKEMKRLNNKREDQRRKNLCVFFNKEVYIKKKSSLKILTTSCVDTV